MRKKTRVAAATLLILAVLWGYARWTHYPADRHRPPQTPGWADSRESVGPDSGQEQIRAAFRERRSGIMVEATGVVDRLLEDDRRGSQHQRLILRLDSGHTLLIAHNIDLAPRVPAEVGDVVAFRGQYEYNRQGGVIHWTHHDPRRRRPGGWIQHRQKVYK